METTNRTGETDPIPARQHTESSDDAHEARSNAGNAAPEANPGEGCASNGTGTALDHAEADGVGGDCPRPAAPSATFNLALAVATGIVDPALADARNRAESQCYTGSPALRKKSIFSDIELLRAHAAQLRVDAEDLMFGEMPNAIEAQQLTRSAKEYDAAAAKLAALYNELLGRAERRESRDGALGALKRDPSTGKPWRGAYRYDPSRPEMAALYNEKLHPRDVFSDSVKLVRADGGRYGLVGSLIVVVHEAAERAGATLSDGFAKEVVKGVAYDMIERVHGMGEGQCRDAAWIMHLWSQATGEPLRLDDIPVRQPLKGFNEWVTTEFEAEYAKGLKRVGLPAAVAEAGNEPRPGAAVDAPREALGALDAQLAEAI